MAAVSIRCVFQILNNKNLKNSNFVSTCEPDASRLGEPALDDRDAFVDALVDLLLALRSGESAGNG
jgi:hypothetical protein